MDLGGQMGVGEANQPERLDRLCGSRAGKEVRMP